MVKKGDMMSVEDVTEILAIDLLGVIPVSYTHLDVYKRQGRYRDRSWTYLGNSPFCH